MRRINKIVGWVEQGQPVYYISTNNLTYENGKEMAQTWADFIRLDLNHGAYDIPGVKEFMRGLVDGGPTATGHKIPGVIAELPVDGTNEMVMRANAWQCRQLLACGLHGLLLCHAETPDAVRAFVESSRFAFQSLGVGESLGQGRRGVGGHENAAEIWGISEEEYMHRADPWPLNPNGELILGVKMENKRALANTEFTSRVPGICFGEWGLADMSNNFGYPMKPEYPLPADLLSVRKRVWDACKAADVHFLSIMNHEDYKEMIDNGVMFCRVYDPEIAVKGRKHTNRPEPW